MKAEDYGFEEYRGHSPTCFDSHINIDDDEGSREHWAIMPVSQTRDSGPLDQSNFAQFLDGLGGESDTVEVHRFGHWGPGWYEIILVDPDDETAMKAAYDMARSLQDYPVLDEEDHSNRCHEAAVESWDLWARGDAEKHIERLTESHFNELFEDNWPTEPEDVASLAVDRYVGKYGLPMYEEESDGVGFPYLETWAEQVFYAVFPMVKEGGDRQELVAEARHVAERVHDLLKPSA